VGIAQGRARTSTFGGNGFCVCACKPLVALRTGARAVTEAHCAAAARADRAVWNGGAVGEN
jgi:hypothetical protein